VTDDGIFVRFVVEVRREGYTIPPGEILRLPVEDAAELVAAGIVVPQRTDTPTVEAETR
jgi:hypothetical protein